MIMPFLPNRASLIVVPGTRVVTGKNETIPE